MVEAFSGGWLELGIMFRGNTMMGGYLKDTKATKKDFSGGWFRNVDLVGNLDLGSMHR